MRVLVTGAAGFIGSHLCVCLVREGHEVVALDDLSDSSIRRIKQARGIRFIRADLRDQEAVARAGSGCEIVFHQGAKRAVPRSIEEPALFTDVNVRGTLNVLLSAQEEGARVVFASSSSVYGDQDRFPLVESMLPRPKSPYAATKLAGEAYCHAFWTSLKVPTVSLRYFNVFGPGQDPGTQYAAVIPRFIMACLNHERPVVQGDGKQSRDFTYIDDAIQANLRAAAAPEEALGRVYNVGGGANPTSINELLQIVAELTGTQPDPVNEPDRPGDVRKTEADISLARRHLGYEPRVSLREGLERTVEHFRAFLKARR
jgi:UDP-glucose 4-epimerase